MFSKSTILNTNNTFKVLVRYKRTKGSGEVNAATQKIVNQLSVLSASRKQPKLLNLCNEDLIKHKTIMNAWNLFKSKKNLKREEQLRKQYESMKNAMEDLKNTNKHLYKLANSKPNKKEVDLFPIEMRIPTDYPPTIPWIYSYKPRK
ncbi:unnamed protein product [Candida verbasci]|uniref:Large ribosomal subunit protein mL40 n=1 Tax=Candida verbasci TaxID=1227364 RepID=A0A9W4XKT2_9ASCO|nr:unnamed protein product [Candida verbasci]